MSIWSYSWISSYCHVSEQRIATSCQPVSASVLYKMTRQQLVLPCNNKFTFLDLGHRILATSSQSTGLGHLGLVSHNEVMFHNSPAAISELVYVQTEICTALSHRRRVQYTYSRSKSSPPYPPRFACWHPQIHRLSARLGVLRFLHKL